MSISSFSGVEELVPDGSGNLSFRTDYPQIETKLRVRGAGMDAARLTRTGRAVSSGKRC